MSNFYGNPEA